MIATILRPATLKYATYPQRQNLRTLARIVSVIIEFNLFYINTN